MKKVLELVAGIFAIAITTTSPVQAIELCNLNDPCILTCMMISNDDAEWYACVSSCTGGQGCQMVSY